MDELIKILVEAYGPSGFEDNIRRIIQEEIASYADEISIDSMGNLIALKKGDGSGQSVMVAAHMDEIGIMTTHITENGFLRFTNIGGVRPQTLMGSRVQFSDGSTGVIYTEKMDSWNRLHGQDKHYIDVGATSKELCPVGVGWAASFVRPFTDIGGRYISKSMDDRIGCAVGVESLRRISERGTTPHDIFFVFSVQEEVGTRGAQTAANALKVDVGIALDVTATGDTPEAETMARGSYAKCDRAQRKETYRIKWKSLRGDRQTHGLYRSQAPDAPPGVSQSRADTFTPRARWWTPTMSRTRFSFWSKYFPIQSRSGQILADDFQESELLANTVLGWE
jgi:putative aminopeptidase FrvX